MLPDHLRCPKRDVYKHRCMHVKGHAFQCEYEAGDSHALYSEKDVAAALQKTFRVTDLKAWPLLAEFLDNLRITSL